MHVFCPVLDNPKLVMPCAIINQSKVIQVMPMKRNVKNNRVSEDWTVIFLQSVFFNMIADRFSLREIYKQINNK